MKLLFWKEHIFYTNDKIVVFFLFIYAIVTKVRIDDIFNQPHAKWHSIHPYDEYSHISMSKTTNITINLIQFHSSRKKVKKNMCQLMHDSWSNSPSQKSRIFNDLLTLSMKSYIAHVHSNWTFCNNRKCLFFSFDHWSQSINRLFNNTK